MSAYEQTKNLKNAQDKIKELLLEFEKICSKHQITYWLDGGSLLGAVRHQGFIPWDDDLDICLPIEDYNRFMQLAPQIIENQENRLFYFHNSGHASWLDYYGSSELLADGLFPVRIDLIPVKYLPKSDEHLKIDHSLTSIASFYVQGLIKNREAILEEHKHWFPQNEAEKNQKKNEFLDFFFNYIRQVSDEAGKQEDYWIAYIFNDSYVKKTRPHYERSWIFPLQNSLTFEGNRFNHPKDYDAYLKVLFGANYSSLPPEKNRLPHAMWYEENKKLSKDLVHNRVLSIQRLRFSTYSLQAGLGSMLDKVLTYVCFVLGLFFKGKWDFLLRFVKYNVKLLRR